MIASKILKEMGDIYKIKSLRADGAYDTDNLYKLCNQYNLKPIIKPRKNLQQYRLSIRKKQQHQYKENLQFNPLEKEDKV